MPVGAARILWFLGLWVGSVLAVAIVGYAIRLILAA